MSFRLDRLFVIVSSLGVLGVLVAACGGSDMAPPKAPAQESPPRDAAKEESEPKSVQEAQDQIARAQSELNRGGAPTAGGGASPATPQTESKPSATTPRAEPKIDRPGGDACASSCRALASMRRAVTALCKITGDTDNRCADARKTLADNESKVTPTCKCSS